MPAVGPDVSAAWVIAQVGVGGDLPELERSNLEAQWSWLEFERVVQILLVVVYALERKWGQKNIKDGL